jgi:hypothetical protein
MGAEIGVCKGETSVQLLLAFPQTHLVFVDPWIEWPAGSTYHDAHKRTGRWDQNAWKNVEQAARARIDSYALPERYEIQKELSTVAAERYADDAFDFVFIDANHTEESVSADIKAWLPKTKKLLCGHDYGRSYKGVKRAVDNWFDECVEAPGARLWAVDLERWRL